jgi:hypothetical protein
MKNLIVIALGLLAAQAFATDVPMPSVVSVLPDSVFTPMGFDDNDNSQIVIDGMLPNTCYQAAQPIVQIDSVNKKIYVTNQTYVTESDWCIFVLVPYTHVINLGMIPQGQYEVMAFSPKTKTFVYKGGFPISKATAAAHDNFIYAPVTNAHIESSTLTQSNPTVVLTGEVTNSCMVIFEARIITESPDVTTILPIAKMQTSDDCKPMSKPFELKVPLSGLQAKNTLIHVRSLNGQAINLVYHSNK